MLSLWAAAIASAQAIWVTDTEKNTITEYSYSGVAQRTFTVPYPGTDTSGTEYARNVTQGANGTLWVYNGTFSPYISNLSATGSALASYGNGLFYTVNNGSFGGIAVSGSTVFVTRDSDGSGTNPYPVLAYNTTSGTSTQVGTGDATTLNLGQDGLLDVLDDDNYNATTVSVYNPATLALVKQVTLSGSSQTDLRGVTSLSNGHLIIATWEGYLQEYNADGTFYRQILLTESDLGAVESAELNNVSIGADGSYLVGSRFGDVFVVNAQLTAYTQFDPAGQSLDGTFANPVSGPFGPLLTTEIPAQAATYGASYSLTLAAGTFSDPDPGSTLTYAAANLPPGLAFNPTTRAISGVPTQAGTFTGTVTATDGGGRTATASVGFTVARAAATVALTNLTQAYDGSPKAVTVTTGPAGLATTLTYDYSSAVPSYPGTYTVVATVTDPNYSGTATATLDIIDAPPAITQPPASQVAVIGSNAVFSVGVSGSPTLSYQWTFDGAAIAGANGASYTVTDVQAADAGSYAVNVTNSAGSIASAGATLTVDAASIPPSITSLSGDQSAAAGLNASFWVVAAGTPPLAYQWYFNGSAISGATGATLNLASVQAVNAGSYTVTATNAAGSATSGAATLTVTAAGSGAAPVLTYQPTSLTISAGSTATFSVGVKDGGVNSAIAYQWFDNGVPLAGADGSVLVIHNASPANDGSYSCLVSNGFGSVSSSAATLTAISTSDPGKLTNLSCRASVGTGGNVLIAGFVVGGAGTGGSNSFLIRASGPALASFGVPGTLPDPQLLLYAGANFIGSNAGWAGNAEIAGAASAVGAFAWSAPASADSALLESIGAGAYTAQISGASGDTGVALAEIYDIGAPGAGTSAAPRLINISARVRVGTAGNILIAGFVVGGSTSKTVLIRASGPALARFGVAGLLADPALQLYSGSVLLQANSGWKADAQIAAAATSVGAFSWGSTATADSAALVTLPPGAYTAQVSGASGDAGVALIEIYEVP